MPQSESVPEERLSADLPESYARPVNTLRRPVEWDRAAALEKLGNDEKLLLEVAGIFLEEAPQLLQKLKAAVCEKNPLAIERAAHSLKGALSCLGAACSAKACVLEESAREQDLSTVAYTLEEFEQELSDLMQEVRKVVRHETTNC